MLFRDGRDGDVFGGSLHTEGVLVGTKDGDVTVGAGGMLSCLRNIEQRSSGQEPCRGWTDEEK